MSEEADSDMFVQCPVTKYYLLTITNQPVFTQTDIVQAKYSGGAVSELTLNINIIDCPYIHICTSVEN
jgi:hypothetical protein